MEKLWIWVRKLFVKPTRTRVHDFIDEMDECYMNGDKARFDYLTNCLDKIQKGEMEVKDIKTVEALKGEITPTVN